MDFSSLFSKEIDKKRKVAGETKRNKRAKVEDVVDTVNKVDVSDGSADAATPKETQHDTRLYTEEEETLADSIGDDQLDAKLGLFNETCEPGTSKVDKVRKLDVLLRLQRKNETYRVQLEKEEVTERAIKLEDIASDVRDKLHTQVRIHIKSMVREWENDVQLKRNTTADDSDDGDANETVNAAVLLDTKRDLVSLLYKLRTNGLSDSILTSLCTIMYYLQVRDFRRANESYMKLSIGNVAWPIGVKGVGIHERSAALKITGENKQNLANIMLDDKTRRWITSVKRLISFAERKWPI